MTDALPFPETADEISPDWMSAALAESVPGVEVTAVNILDQHSGTTGRLRLGLDYDQAAPGPPTVFVKLPPFDESQRRMVAATDMGRREARFYDGPGRETPLRIPQRYYAAAGDEPTEYVMVLEDLVASGAAFSTRLAPFGEDGAGQLIEGLGRVHAHFWNDDRLTGDWSWIQPAMRGSYGAKLVDSARQQFADQFPPVFDELCRLYVEHHERIAEIFDDGEQTLIHGDTHAGNQFRDGNTVGLYDWAVISRSPGIRDVAIYLGNSCPTELRRAGQDEWLRAYHRVLVDAGVDPPAFEVLWDRYRCCVLYAWIAATTTASMGSKWQPIEVGMLGMTRSTDTCADLDTLGALRGGCDMTAAPQTFATGLDFGEGPRWHDGRLWVSDFYRRRVSSYGPDGDERVEVEFDDDQPSGLGWLPNGDLLAVAMLSRQVRRVDAQGVVHLHADLSAIAGGPCNDMVVDGRGNAYVGNFGFDMEAREALAPADLALVRPDGSVEVAAPALRFPNGSVITPDGRTLIVGESMAARYQAFTIAEDGTLSDKRVWATVSGHGPDGCALDADGAIWMADAGGAGCFRVAEGGDILDRVVTDQPVFACALGGPERRTLFLITAPGFGDDIAAGKGLGRIEATQVDVPGAGWP